jgi:hypothetical protein
MSNPICSICEATGNGAIFPMLPKTEGYKFGDICVPCDELAKVKA